ncbi:hypothetical protein PYCCODRAFT_1435773 [Trametes coccinea BRFM310]|uniref:Uncharacterized protein n=1 Tax=Trametes coccinea (strain BRFM310) TaxID=1353009 RepID=A0A1Y2ILT1_TRAC3|nr:hypothetical protein PYCCODRAFT_1435773 [Trametes coccinea BRFM310]
MTLTRVTKFLRISGTRRDDIMDAYGPGSSTVSTASSNARVASEHDAESQARSAIAAEPTTIWIPRLLDRCLQPHPRIRMHAKRRLSAPLAVRWHDARKCTSAASDFVSLRARSVLLMRRGERGEEVAEFGIPTTTYIDDGGTATRARSLGDIDIL